MPNTTATVETITAEVRVLMVGSRQITISVAKQLDEVFIDEIAQPFGRVRTGALKLDGNEFDPIEVIGRDQNGVLARSHIVRSRFYCTHQDDDFFIQRRGGYARIRHCDEKRRGEPCPGSQGRDVHDWVESGYRYDECSELPLIILAGLR